MYRITLTNRQSALQIDRARLRRIAETVLREEGIASAEISLAIVDDEQIRALNRRHLGHDDPTDVLSFLLESGEAGADASGRWIEAEIVVSAETALREAPRYGWTADCELALYVVHGLLHACGYDDSTPQQKRRMRRREREVLAAVGLQPHDR